MRYSSLTSDLDFESCDMSATIKLGKRVLLSGIFSFLTRLELDYLSVEDTCGLKSLSTPMLKMKKLANILNMDS